jgi:hypothetical protein
MEIDRPPEQTHGLIQILKIKFIYFIFIMCSTYGTWDGGTHPPEESKYSLVLRLVVFKIYNCHGVYKSPQMFAPRMLFSVRHLVLATKKEEAHCTIETG